MFRGSVKSTGFPLHSPVSSSLPLPCVTVCHHISTGLYYANNNALKNYLVYITSDIVLHTVLYLHIVSLIQRVFLRYSLFTWDIPCSVKDMKSKTTISLNTTVNVYMVVFLLNTVIYVFLLLCPCILIYFYVSSSCQLALFGYPDWGFSVLFPQL
jgi:hypothetical protein